MYLTLLGLEDISFLKFWSNENRVGLALNTHQPSVQLNTLLFSTTGHGVSERRKKVIILNQSVNFLVHSFCRICGFFF